VVVISAGVPDPRPRAFSSFAHPEVTLATMAANVWLLQGAAEQNPDNQLFKGGTIEVFVPPTKIGRSPEGLRHAASGDAITSVTDFSQPDEKLRGNNGQILRVNES
jgi:hypothetical protein